MIEGSAAGNPSLELWAEMTEIVGSNCPSKRATPTMFVIYEPSTVGSEYYKQRPKMDERRLTEI